MDYRKQDLEVRLEYFEKYFYWSLKFYDCDSNLFLLNYIHKRLELNLEQRYWVAWLYGNTYQLATAWVIGNEFPDFENVDLERLTWWNNNNYERLRYQSDQKWQKGHLPKMFESYRDNIYSKGKTQKEFFEFICNSECPYENFDNLYKYIIKNFYKFGRYSAWFYIQTLKETCDLNVEPRDLLLKDDNTHTQRDGLCYALAKDEWVGDKELRKDSEKVDILNSGAEMILDIMKSKHSDVNSDMFLLETTLCAFKKTFRKKKGRYLGYYLDRQYDDIKKVEGDNWTGIDWELLWDGRNELLDKRTNRNSGVVNEDMQYFLDTGNIKYYDYLNKDDMEYVKTLKSKEDDDFDLIEISKNDEDVISLLREWAKDSDECSHFYSLWTRFKNWDNPNAYVYVLISGNNIAGMNAFTCNKRNPYVNCYYFEIDEKYRQLGLGSKLFFSCIYRGKNNGNTRLTLRTKFNSLGMKFYNAIGMKERYFDPKTKENIFDFNIEYIENLKDIKINSDKINDTPHKSRLKIYEKYEEL